MAYCTQSGRWDIDFNRSMGTLESFPIKISLHFWSCAGQPLFHVHALLITVACVSVTLFSEKIQACSRHSCLISPDGRLLKQGTVALFGTCPVAVRSPVPPPTPLWCSWSKCGPLTPTTGVCDWFSLVLSTMLAWAWLLRPWLPPLLCWWSRIVVYCHKSPVSAGHCDSDTQVSLALLPPGTFQVPSFLVK